MEAEAILDPVPVPVDAPSPPPQVSPVFPIHPKTRPSQAPGAERRRAPAKEPRSFLWYGDNLDVLRDHIKDESVDLIYLDPPFNSNRSYNVIFRGPDGLGAPAQIQAFDDTWTWTDTTNQALHDISRTAPAKVWTLIDSLCHALDHNDVTAYLVMMTQRLVELHRVMKPTASLYLHCDPTASHYLKIMLDAIFGKEGFRNEIIWRRTRSHNDQKLTRFGAVHDAILFYSKGSTWTFNRQYMQRDERAPKTHDLYRHTDGQLYRKGDCRAPGGRGPRFEWNGHIENWRFTEENARQLEVEGRVVYSKNGMPRLLRPVDPTRGAPMQDVWLDIDPPNSGAAESLGYQTQKPLALLERIVSASSNPGDVVLDPFCGCGTAVDAAERLGRRWVGIDVTSLAIGVIEKRLDDRFEAADFGVFGLPESKDDAVDLAKRDPFQFQWWAAGRLGALPHDGRNKKGRDRGVDGIIPFFDDATGRVKRCIVSVKSGRNVGPEAVRDLLGTVVANDAAAGVLLTMEAPTSEMRRAAAVAGMYRSTLGRDYPKLQILTVEDVLNDRIPDLPEQEAQRRRLRRLAAQRNEQQQFPGWS